MAASVPGDGALELRGTAAAKQAPGTANVA
jgi:hypothetical protein